MPSVKRGVVFGVLLRTPGTATGPKKALAVRSEFKLCDAACILGSRARSMAG